MDKSLIPIININAELFVLNDIDNKKIIYEASNINDRYSYNPISVAFEDRVIHRAEGTEINKLLSKVESIGTSYGLDLVHYHLLKHEPLEATNTHNHRNESLGVVLSWVYYVSVPRNSGKLVFMFDQYDIGPSYIHEPVEGTLLLFPPYLLHKVTKNMSGENRISIAGDFAVKRG